MLQKYILAGKFANLAYLCVKFYNFDMAKKKKPLPLLEKITITGIAAEGKAIAKKDDLVIFVPYVVPGDMVDLQLTRKKNSYAEAKVVYFH